jgi:hypothetical protein
MRRDAGCQASDGAKWLTLVQICTIWLPKIGIDLDQGARFPLMNQTPKNIFDDSNKQTGGKEAEDKMDNREYPQLNCNLTGE